MLGETFHNFSQYSLLKQTFNVCLQELKLKTDITLHKFTYEDTEFIITITKRRQSTGASKSYAIKIKNTSLKCVEYDMSLTIVPAESKGLSFSSHRTIVTLKGKEEKKIADLNLEPELFITDLNMSIQFLLSIYDRIYSQERFKSRVYGHFLSQLLSSYLNQQNDIQFKNDNQDDEEISWSIEGIDLIEENNSNYSIKSTSKQSNGQNDLEEDFKDEE